MRATFDGLRHEINGNHRKENKYSGGVLGIIFENGEFNTTVDLRYYWTDSRCYACVWVNDSKARTWTGGSGYAGGAGYHKQSAAAESAFRAAGILLDECISGRGDGAVEDAVQAICKALRPGAAVYVQRVHA